MIKDIKICIWTKAWMTDFQWMIQGDEWGAGQGQIQGWSESGWITQCFTWKSSQTQKFYQTIKQARRPLTPYYVIKLKLSSAIQLSDTFINLNRKYVQK